MCRTYRVVLATLLVVANLPVAADEPESKKEAGSKAKVAVIRLEGSLPETAGQLGLFSDLQPSLPDLVARLDAAAKDKEVSAVLLQLRSPSVGRGKLEEVRAAIRRVRAAGKRVVADLNAATTADYLLAVACDEIAMPESGVLLIPGVRAEITFFRGLFDKLGIEADMMQVGDFKGAAEPFTREQMSPEFRQQYEQLLDDVYEQMIETIARDRKLEASRVRDLIDVGLFTPGEAKAAGLIDALVYEDELDDRLQEALQVGELELLEDFGRRKRDTDFSGMLGMMKLFEMMMGIEPAKRASSKQKIAVIYATGIIMPGDSAASLLGGEVMGSKTIVEAIHEAEQDKSVVAIVLRVDSPGGSALASDLIWRAIGESQKPVIASMGDVAASGGYYISMGCDKIFAEPGTLTGSIGVVGGKLVLSGLYGKLGVNTEVVSRGKNTGLLSLDQPFTDSERTVTRRMMEEIYRLFFSKASAGRRMTAEQMEPLASGRVWTGRQAREHGLVDEVGTLKDAIAAASAAGGIAEGVEPELLILPQPKSIFDQLFGSDLALRSGVQQLRELAPSLADRVRTAATIQRLFAEPGIYLMPYHVTIR